MKIHMKGWVAYVTDIDVTKATDEEINILGNLLAEQTVILIKDQGHMTPKDDHEFTGRFGHHDLFLEVKTNFPHFYDAIQVYPDAPSISRVTGKKNENGKPGLHGHSHDLDWHCNKPHQQDRVRIAYLRAVSGTVGSRTSYINGVQAYSDLSDEWKQRIEDVTVLTSSHYDSYSTIGEIFGLPEGMTSFPPDKKPKLVQTNFRGDKAILMPIFQMDGLGNCKSDEDAKEIYDFMMQHYFQEKYIGHIDWEDGDVNLADQSSGIHKRWAFDKMETRLMHRIGHDYDNINLVDNYLDGIEVTYE